MEHDGEGAEPLEAAITWYRAASKTGDVEAVFLLSRLLKRGEKADFIFEAEPITSGFQGFRVAAEHGHRDAQTELGHCYEHGIGVAQDQHAAFHWCRSPSIACCHFWTGTGLTPATLISGLGRSLLTFAPGLGSPLPSLGLGSTCQVCTGTRPTFCHICAGTGLTAAHICTATCPLACSHSASFSCSQVQYGCRGWVRSGTMPRGPLLPTWNCSREKLACGS
jgi:hypothetical protein